MGGAGRQHDRVGGFAQVLLRGVLGTGLLGVFCAGAVHAADCARPYTVLASPGGLNVHLAGAPERPQGFLPDLLQALAARSGCVLTLEVLPHERLLTLAEQGRADMLGNVSPAARPLPDRSFLTVARLEVLLYVLAGSGLRSLDDLGRRSTERVGRLRRGAEPEAVSAFFAGLDPERIDVSETADILARKLAAGRIAGYFGTPLYSAGGQREAGLAGRVRALPLDTPPYRIGWSIFHARVPPADRARLTESLEGLRRDGTLEALLARHIGAEAARRAVRMP